MRRDFTEMEIACTRALSSVTYLRSSYTRSNLTLSNLLLLLFPQPQAHQRIPGPSGSKSADHMGAAACVVEGANWGMATRLEEWVDKLKKLEEGIASEVLVQGLDFFACCNVVLRF